VSQQDDFPIGPLLPPTTWAAGDAKPGYMVLTLPPKPPNGSGRYTVVVGLYDPVTQQPITHSDGVGSPSDRMVEIGLVEQSQEGQRLR